MLSYGTQMTQIYTEEHRFLFFSMQTQRSLKIICVNLCPSVLSVCDWKHQLNEKK